MCQTSTAFFFAILYLAKATTIPIAVLFVILIFCEPLRPFGKIRVRGNVRNIYCTALDTPNGLELIHEMRNAALIWHGWYCTLQLKYKYKPQMLFSVAVTTGWRFSLPDYPCLEIHQRWTLFARYWSTIILSISMETFSARYGGMVSIFITAFETQRYCHW